MEFSMDAVANKLIVVIIVISAVMAVCSFVIFSSLSGNENASVVAGTLMGVHSDTTVTSDGIQFSIGIFAVMCLNIAKVLLMKKAVSNAVNRDKAGTYLQGQYFMRMALTAGILIIVAWLHGMKNDAGNPQYVNLMGAFFGIFSFPIAMYSMRFFLRHELKDSEIIEAAKSGKSVAESAIEKLNSIGNDKQ